MVRKRVVFLRLPSSTPLILNYPLSCTDCPPFPQAFSTPAPSPPSTPPSPPAAATRGIVVHLDDISNAVPPPSLPLIQTSAHIPFPTARTVALAAVCAGALIIVLVLLSRRGGRRCSRTRFPRPDSEPVGQGYVLHESDASSEDFPMTAVNWSTRSARGPESNFTHNKSS